MLFSAFYRHGLVCAKHPWVAIGGTLALTLSMTVVAFFGEWDWTYSRICGWNLHCAKKVEKYDSDVIILSIARCVAAAYIYLQFRKLDALGLKYMLGLAGLISISVAVSSGLVHILEYELNGLGDSLAFFLLLLDLSKVTALAKYSLGNSASKDANVEETVARGVAILGPSMTLDTVVKVLVIAVGCLSEYPLLIPLCCFGCVSLVVHYIVFMTCFPGLLCLILKSDGSRRGGAAEKALKHEMEDTPNAVAQRVKVIVCSGLALVHIYSRLFTDKPPIMEQTDQEARTIVPSISLWRFYFRELLNFSPQQLIGYVFVLLICIKHLFYDKATQPCELLTPSSCGSEKGTEEGSSKAQSSNHWQDSDREREASSNERCLQRQQVRPNVRHDKEVQTETETCTERGSPVESSPKFSSSSFSVKGGTETLKDDEILALLRSKRLQPYKLEEEVGDLVRAVKIRRDLVSSELPNRNCLDLLPFSRYDYSFVTGTCCENVIGYLPVPVGVAGPLLLDGKKYQVPLATTEGCLVASINRGCRAICLSGGCTSQLVGDGMTRAPVVKFPSIKGSVQAKRWIDGSGGTLLKEAFDRTSRFARLQSVQAVVAGRQLFIRFKATTGDAMGMNMVCKGTESALSLLQHHFPDMQVVALSGNFCTDKKPAALNWIQGRGKSVVCEAIISGDVLRNVLKTTTTSIVELNTRKNLIGSAMAGTVGGYNAHAANAVTAIFLATGQDVAQNVVSSGCLTEMEPWSENPEYLYVACTMPCLEVGTVGGGTNLPPQKACLKMLGVDGSSAEKPGKNAEYLARIICATVLAGELSLLSALQAGHLVQSHLKHNRSKVEINPAELGAPVAFPAHPAPCSA